jgi:hypothetical protein
MINKTLKTIIIVVSIILLSCSVSPSNSVGKYDSYHNFHVSQYGSNDFNSIQDAINASSDGDTIYIDNGIYYENIIINKKIRIIGEDNEETIIDGRYADHVIKIIVEGVIIENFTIRNSGGFSTNSSIKIFCNSTIIKNCIIKRSKIGINITNFSRNIINNCTFYDNAKGIFLKKANTSKISGCIFAHNSIAFISEMSKNIEITYSYFHTNGISCIIVDSNNFQFYNCNISDNGDNHGGIFISNNTNSVIDNCIIRHNGIGVNIDKSEDTIINNCNIDLNTHFGIFIKYSSTKITYCNITNSFRYGIYICEKSSVDIFKNNIFGNMLHGLYVENSETNAKNNYWGSELGPVIFDINRGSRVFFNIFHGDIFPWISQPLKNSGASWLKNKEFMDDNTEYDYNKIIIFDEIDTDSDGIPDWWEVKWDYDPLKWDEHKLIDEDEDGLNNFQECYTDNFGSSPYVKDVFVEIDWMKNDKGMSNKPNPNLIEELIKIFSDHEITLHIDIGIFGGGEEIPCNESMFSFSKLIDVYWDYFLKNNLDNHRNGIFRYGIICNYCPDLNFPFFGWNNFDSFAVSADWLKAENPLINRDRLIIGGLVHQLGSTMGLLAETHGGNDNLEASKLFTIQWFKYINYKSCMNYYYKYRIFKYSDGSHGFGDFDDWNNLNLCFFKNSTFYI